MCYPSHWIYTSGLPGGNYQLLFSLSHQITTMGTLSTPRGRDALAVSTVFTTLATVFVAIRIYTRAFMVKQMGADDYAILIALVRTQRTKSMRLRETKHRSIGFLMGLLWLVCGWYVIIRSPSINSLSTSTSTTTSIECQYLTYIQRSTTAWAPTTISFPTTHMSPKCGAFGLQFQSTKPA